MTTPLWWMADNADGVIVREMIFEAGFTPRDDTVELVRALRYPAGPLKGTTAQIREAVARARAYDAARRAGQVEPAIRLDDPDDIVPPTP